MKKANFILFFLLSALATYIVIVVKKDHSEAGIKMINYKLVTELKDPTLSVILSQQNDQVIVGSTVYLLSVSKSKVIGLSKVETAKDQINRKVYDHNGICFNLPDNAYFILDTQNHKIAWFSSSSMTKDSLIVNILLPKTSSHPRS